MSRAIAQNTSTERLTLIWRQHIIIGLAMNFTRSMPKSLHSSTAAHWRFHAITFSFHSVNRVFRSNKHLEVRECSLIANEQKMNVSRFILAWQRLSGRPHRLPTEEHRIGTSWWVFQSYKWDRSQCYYIWPCNFVTFWLKNSEVKLPGILEKDARILRRRSAEWSKKQQKQYEVSVFKKKSLES